MRWGGEWEGGGENGFFNGHSLQAEYTLHTHKYDNDGYVLTVML